MKPRIYTAEWVVPISSDPIRDGAVAVEDDRIAFVGLRDQCAHLFRDRECEEIDLHRAALLPGFVNVHTHLELTVMRGFLEDLPFREWILKLTKTKYEKLLPEDLAASAMFGAAEAIRAGVTTVADTGDSSAAFDALIAGGLRGIAYREVFGPDPAAAQTSLDDLKEKVDRMRAQETSRVRVGVSPHATYTVSARLFSLVADYASRLTLDVCIHAAESKAERDLMLAGTGPFADGFQNRGIDWKAPGVSTVAYLESISVLDLKPLLVHCVNVSSDDIDLLSGRGVRVAHCPKSNAKLGHGVAPLIEMVDAGVCIGLGTDSVASNNRCDMLSEALACCMIHRANTGSFDRPSAKEMLLQATINGARALGLSEQIGSLEEGKQADIIAIDLSKSHVAPINDLYAALIFSARGSDVILNMVAGRVLFDGREVKTVDEDRVKIDLRRAADRMA